MQRRYFAESNRCIREAASGGERAKSPVPSCDRSDSVDRLDHRWTKLRTYISNHRRFTYVIVHGAFGGGWAWREVDAMMTADGQKVFRPTLTGQGERVHLSSADVTLNTHIQDIVNTILFEDLHDVVLVGHSYGGMVITGVVDRIPDRIKCVIYLDAILPEDGESAKTAGGESFHHITTMEPNAQGLVVPTWIKENAPLPHDEPEPIGAFAQVIFANKSGDCPCDTDNLRALFSQR